MAQIAYIGLPGAGKSYDIVASVILPALKKGRIVYHNLVLKEAELMKLAGYRGMLVQIPEGASAEDVVRGHPPGAIVVLDEIYQYWPAGVSAAKIPKEQLEYFAKHRHSLDWLGRSTNVYIVDQELSTTASFITKRIDKTAIHTKLDDMGLSKRYRVDIYNRSVSLDNPPEKKYVRSLLGKYDPAIYACYKSHTLDSRTGAGIAEGDVLEERAEKRATVWGDWRVRFALASLALIPVVGMMGLNTYRDFTGMGQEAEPGEYVAERSITRSDDTSTPATTTQPAQLVKVGHAVPVDPQVSAPPVYVDNRPKFSRMWRIAGVITTASGGGFVRLESSSGHMRLRSSECMQDQADNWRCDVSDGIATMWSGARMVGDGHTIPMTAAAVAPGALQKHGT